MNSAKVISISAKGQISKTVPSCSSMMCYMSRGFGATSSSCRSYWTQAKAQISVRTKFLFLLILQTSGWFLRQWFILRELEFCQQYPNKRYYLTKFIHVKNDSIIWHAKLGHIGTERITWLARKGLLGPLTSVNLSICEKCLTNKSTRKLFGKAICASAPLDLIYFDIYAPFNVKALNEYSNYITFIDDFSRYSHVYLISHKSEAVRYFLHYLVEVENKLSRRVKILRTGSN